MESGVAMIDSQSIYSRAKFSFLLGTKCQNIYRQYVYTHMNKHIHIHIGVLKIFSHFSCLNNNKNKMEKHLPKMI